MCFNVLRPKCCTQQSRMIVSRQDRHHSDSALREIVSLDGRSVRQKEVDHEFQRLLEGQEKKGQAHNRGDLQEAQTPRQIRV
jgi:hypothetical protein